MNTSRTTSYGRRRSLRSVTLLTTAALALTIGLGACGRDEAGGGADEQGEAIEDGAAERHHRGLGHGHRGRRARRLRRRASPTTTPTPTSR